MIDADVRALVVKTLTEPQLVRLHLWENQHGVPMHPAGAVEILHTSPLKAHYGVLERKGRVQAKVLREWGTRVRGAVDRFMRESGARFTTENLADLHAFDRAVWASDLDLYYRTATPAKQARGWRNNLDHA